ncbi:type II toxin-antitoxin system HipA family toxin [Acidipropionibacterium virtanenii]|uniref:Serine/threonine-protein kinase HipA n=1 Tax=Acidipropionibacterium virtanenii TaxID=2057246 RepID=A0A344UWQ4_9ACTN|nr:type II toxin-antitoxin system HipA family toxin [Acidipropionibacterium virtanenii]AXE39702.1 Serine/threonine-protein kinase HipA [Acidipropionibacterium virtanenii]
MTDVLDVYLNSRLTGRLNRDTDGSVSFDYVDSTDPTPLSLSMPKGASHHSPDVTMPWLDNLLPDNDEVRRRWATEFGERRATPFNLLRHMGADCAGAVQVVPAGEIPGQDGALTGPSETEIASHIRTLRADDAAWDFEERGGRWSLGGQQGKFALARMEDGWFLPSGRAASTHIVKVGIAAVPDSDIAEFVTMRTAALLGLPVPTVEYAQFGDQAVLVAERFDRLKMNEDVRRLHQEDLCQAMGLWRSSKYQSDGGPSSSDVVEFLERTLDPRDRDRGIHDFARALVFNWILAGTDAHAKNYALLHLGSRTILAPFYDLISTALLWPAKQVHFEGRLAMKFGGEYRLRRVDLGRCAKAASELRVPEEFLVGITKDYLTRIPDAVATALKDLSDSVADSTRARMQDAMAERLTQVNPA